MKMLPQIFTYLRKESTYYWNILLPYSHSSSIKITHHLLGSWLSLLAMLAIILPATSWHGMVMRKKYAFRLWLRWREANHWPLDIKCIYKYFEIQKSAGVLTTEPFSDIMQECFVFSIRHIWTTHRWGIITMFLIREYRQILRNFITNWFVMW